MAMPCDRGSRRKGTAVGLSRIFATLLAMLVLLAALAMEIDRQSRLSAHGAASSPVANHAR